jgi:hypothetical protein
MDVSEISDHDVFWMSVICGIVAIVSASRAVLSQTRWVILFVVAIIFPTFLIALEASDILGRGPFLHHYFPTLICAIRGGKFCEVEVVKSDVLTPMGTLTLSFGVFAGAFALVGLGCSKNGSRMTRLVTSALAGGVILSCALRLFDAYGLKVGEIVLAQLPPAASASLVETAILISELKTKLLVALADAARSLAKTLESAARSART